MTNLYAYGLTATGFPDSALDGLAGIGGAPVVLLQAGEYRVLVTRLTRETPSTAAGAAPAPMAGNPPVARTRRNLLAHTHVLETCHRAASVLPFRFGTVAPDAASLASCVAGNRAGFAEAMRAVANRIELGLRASFKEGVMFARLAANDLGLRELRERLRGRPEAESYYARIELGRRIEAGLAALRKAETARLASELAAIADRLAVLPAQEETVIFNHAYLLPRDQEAAFDAAVERLATRAGEDIALRYVGPMPPFNFVDLQAGWLTTSAAGASTNRAA